MSTPISVKIMGFPRSGTSLLQRLLDAHPQVYAPPEPYVFSGAARMIAESRGEGPDLGMLTGLSFAGFPPGQVIDRVRRFATSFLDEGAAAAGKPVWAEKSAFDIFDLPQIETLLAGHYRFICVIRNPLDVVASMKDLSDVMGHNVPAMRPYLMRHDSFWLAYAEAWREQTQALLDFHDRQGDASLLYRYEDLTADPDTQLALIADHMGITAFPAGGGQPGDKIGLGDWKTFATTGISRAPVARWRKTLPRSSAAAVLEIVAPLMQRLDYDRPTIRAPRSRDERITQYQRAKRLAMETRDKGQPS
ncbi:sulfotransferase family protein [Paracoccus tegillarcae]|uniref:Sulfotransferase n=1 Tax=Paracoccus tegillarcae TaxID=1529068 RepID=A0A2K9EBL8_9RHOB|nr:sulfotransferase [Paracoccus tegillarcae]AUH32280.1 hypothetical protein CUV01_01700 [Paracoccus tegillarcae]